MRGTGKGDARGAYGRGVGVLNARDGGAGLLADLGAMVEEGEEAREREKIKGR